MVGVAADDGVPDDVRHSVDAKQPRNRRRRKAGDFGQDRREVSESSEGGPDDECARRVGSPEVRGPELGKLSPEADGLLVSRLRNQGGDDKAADNRQCEDEPEGCAPTQVLVDYGYHRHPGPLILRTRDVWSFGVLNCEMRCHSSTDF